MIDILRYPGKRVVVSGCASGMGEATARTLIGLGAEVHGLDFKDCALPLAGFHKTDLRHPASIDAAVEGLGGPIDALFNCAGLAHTWPPMDVMKVNFIGTRYLTERVIERMPAGGAIASISSTGGMGWNRRIPTLIEFIGLNSYAAAVRWCEANPEIVGIGYAFAKELIVGWTQYASSTLIKRGIRINCTLPGPTQTPMMNDFEAKSAAATLIAATRPIDRRSTPQEQANPLIFLNSEAASYINGVALPTDGGFLGGIAMGTVSLTGVGGLGKLAESAEATVS